MELSRRLGIIVNHVDKCDKIADIGTDHGYVPIHLIKNKICKEAIASDINKGPIEKAKMNVSFEGLKDKVKCLLGPGLKPLKKGEVNGIIIAGMGGNLTRDILSDDIEKVKLFKFLILQPAQNPEVLREYLYNNNFEIIDEDLIKDDEKYYELFKVKYNEGSSVKVEDILDYEFSPILRKKNHPLFREYLDSKIMKYTNIMSYIKDDTSLAVEKREFLDSKIKKIKGMI